jgi:ATP-dependent protease HslVU (ClpYQ) peptidase subunit
MTVGIAAVCKHGEEFAVVLCADWQGTRGDFVKASDTYKMRHFPDAAVLISGDVDAGAEFAAMCHEIVAEFNAIEKPDGDFDARVGRYLDRLRKAAQAFKRSRADHKIQTKYAISLADFYSSGIKEKLSERRYDDIANDVYETDLGGDFIFAYVGDEEPILVTIYRDGHVSWDETEFCAIGSGGDIALAIWCQPEMPTYLTLRQCIAWVYQAKIAAEKNPHVSKETSMAVLMRGKREYDLTEKTWTFLRKLPVPVPFPTEAIKRWEKQTDDIIEESGPEFFRGEKH